MGEQSELKAPVLLLAMPQIQDPFFRQSVVLLLAHEDGGSFGFVVNRPSNLKVGQILEDLEIEWHGDPGAVAYVGGPVQPQIGTVLVQSPAATEEDPLQEVAPGICITQSLDHLARLARSPASAMRLLLGYAGWGGGQLEGEITRHDWLVAPVAASFVFDQDSDRAWEDALHSLGIEAASLPTWTGGDQHAN